VTVPERCCARVLGVGAQVWGRTDLMINGRRVLQHGAAGKKANTLKKAKSGGKKAAAAAAAAATAAAATAAASAAASGSAASSPTTSAINLRTARLVSVRADTGPLLVSRRTCTILLEKVVRPPAIPLSEPFDPLTCPRPGPALLAEAGGARLPPSLFVASPGPAKPKKKGGEPDLLNGPDAERFLRVRFDTLLYAVSAACDYLATATEVGGSTTGQCVPVPVDRCVPGGARYPVKRSDAPDTSEDVVKVSVSDATARRALVGVIGSDGNPAIHHLSATQCAASLAAALTIRDPAALQRSPHSPSSTSPPPLPLLPGVSAGLAAPVCPLLLAMGASEFSPADRARLARDEFFRECIRLLRIAGERARVLLLDPETTDEERNGEAERLARIRGLILAQAGATLARFTSAAKCH
jgi:hypothetical protein